MRRVVALLLAGGVGSRLNVLVRHRAKPAVPFGGIYRIIDFTLSNLANSGLTRVAVLTQYKPLSLMDHIGDGSSWDLSGRTRSVKILPPKTGEKDWDWYRGTADAVRQNLEFITRGDFTEVLLVSGDHIYCMDYQPLVEFHRAHAAQVTIGVLPVPWEETNQFGCAIVDETSRIVDWEEKPAKARSNLASMGIYVFDRQYLVTTLQETKGEDFGRHIVPKALREANVYGYPFHGYWRDVGTIQAYWDANMDLLDPDSGLSPGAAGVMPNVTNEGIAYDRPPARIADSARVKNSVVSPGCVINGTVEHAILSPGVIVEEGAQVRDSIIMHDAVVHSGAKVERCIIDKEVKVGRRAVVGRGDARVVNARYPQQVFSGLTVIGKRAAVPERAVVGTNCVIEPDAREQDFPDKKLKDGETIEKGG
jgi:glucose-1-phosphate adenylyltransferase